MPVVVTRSSAPPTRIDVVDAGSSLTFSPASGRHLRARLTVKEGGENWVEITSGEARELGKALIEWADSQS